MICTTQPICKHILLHSCGFDSTRLHSEQLGLSNYTWQVSWHFTLKTAATMRRHLKQVAEVVSIATHHDS